MSEPSLDRIHIRDLIARCVIGIYPDERQTRQEILFNITLHADLRQAAKSDRIDDTFDYKTIKKQVLDMAEASQFELIESLAERAAAICLEAPHVQRVDVTVDKPGALTFARSVAVSISREKAR